MKTARTKQRDTFGRSIDYLRISITDKCNYRCVYCMPEQGVALRRHEDMLTVEEIAHFVQLAAHEGIRRVRLTGGEPLVSRRTIPLIRALRSIDGIEDISLTTNGALLPAMAAELKRAGLDRVNISLDTLDAEQFSKITRRGNLDQTLAGIQAAQTYGFDPVKINTVVVRRLHQDLFALACLSLDRPVHVRFIEYMPIGNKDIADTNQNDLRSDLWNASDIIPSCELREHIASQGAAAGLGTLVEADPSESFGAGPARYWKFPEAQGTIGFISAMSHHFCDRCNRLRLTAEGTLRPCLFSDDEYCIRDALRAGDDEAVMNIYRTALACKPQEHTTVDGTARFMSQIGG